MNRIATLLAGIAALTVFATVAATVAEAADGCGRGYFYNVRRCVPQGEPLYRPYDRRDRGPSVDLGPNIRLDFGDRGPRYRTRDRCRDYDDC